MREAKLYSPPDVDAAWRQWKCSCGPASLAALLGRPCADLREHFPGMGERGYANPTHLLAACASMDVPVKVRKTDLWIWPDFGLVFVQWGGPWLKPGVPVGAAYRHTHWVAVRGPGVYDVNVGHWVTADDWKRPGGVAAWLMSQVPRCDGTWSTRIAIDVQPSDAAAVVSRDAVPVYGKERAPC